MARTKTPIDLIDSLALVQSKFDTSHFDVLELAVNLKCYFE